LTLRQRYPVPPLEHMLAIINKPDIDLSRDADDLQRAKARELTARKDDMAKAAALLRV